jgi:hypothetical protein
MMHNMKLALAWYIDNDETYSGDNWEQDNEYYLAGKRTALATFFDSYDEVQKLAKDYYALIAKGELPCLTEQEDENFYVEQQEKTKAEENKAEILQNIADEIIETVDGTFYLDEPDSFRALSADDQVKVMSLVYDRIGNCDHCGWHFNHDQLEQNDVGETLCWNCLERYEEELREEDENSLV